MGRCLLIAEWSFRSAVLIFLVATVGCNPFKKDKKGSDTSDRPDVLAQGVEGESEEGEIEFPSPVFGEVSVEQGTLQGVEFSLGKQSVSSPNTGAVRGSVMASGVRGASLGGADQGIRGGVRGGVRAAPARDDTPGEPVRAYPEWAGAPRRQSTWTPPPGHVCTDNGLYDDMFCTAWCGRTGYSRDPVCDPVTSTAYDDLYDPEDRYGLSFAKVAANYARSGLSLEDALNKDAFRHENRRHLDASGYLLVTRDAKNVTLMPTEDANRIMCDVAYRDTLTGKSGSSCEFLNQDDSFWHEYYLEVLRRVNQLYGGTFDPENPDGSTYQILNLPLMVDCTEGGMCPAPLLKHKALKVCAPFEPACIPYSRQIYTWIEETKESTVYTATTSTWKGKVQMPEFLRTLSGRKDPLCKNFAVPYDSQCVLETPALAFCHDIDPACNGRAIPADACDANGLYTDMFCSSWCPGGANHYESLLLGALGTKDPVCDPVTSTAYDDLYDPEDRYGLSFAKVAANYARSGLSLEDALNKDAFRHENRRHLDASGYLLVTRDAKNVTLMPTEDANRIMCDLAYRDLLAGKSGSSCEVLNQDESFWNEYYLEVLRRVNQLYGGTFDPENPDGSTYQILNLPLMVDCTEGGMCPAPLLKHKALKVCAPFEPACIPYSRQIYTWIEETKESTVYTATTSTWKGNVSIPHYIKGETAQLQAFCGSYDIYTDGVCAPETSKGRLDLLAVCARLDPDCDLCEAEGWYGDGICHKNCSKPDPDCALPAEQTGTVVPEARVEVAGTSVSTVTDEEGNYILTDLPPGTYTIIIKKEGSDGQVYAASQTVTVEADKETNAGIASIEETGAIMGKVQRADATVHLGTDVFVPGTNFIAKTDDLGNFKMIYVPKGKYEFAAMFPGFAIKRWKEVEVKPKETTDIGAAQLTRLDADKAKAALVAGQVLSISGSPIADVVITTTPESLSVRSDSAGNFALANISPGVYLVRGSKAGFATASKFVDLTAVLFKNVQLVMPPGGIPADSSIPPMSLTIDGPTSIEPAKTATFKAVVAGGDPVANVFLTWTVEAGSLDSTKSQDVKWTVPNALGIFDITATATDGTQTAVFALEVKVAGADQSVSIDITAPPPVRPDKLVLTQNGPGTADTLGGNPGAIEAVATIKTYSDGLLSVMVGSATAKSDGSFDAFSIGDNQGDANDSVYLAVFDPAGNISPVYFVVNDKTPPDTLLTDGICPTGLTTCQVNQTTATFKFSANESGGTFECKLNAASYQSCTSPKAYTGLAEGNHTFTVRATDKANNVDPTPVTITWRVDVTPPVAGILALQNGATTGHVDGNFDMQVNFDDGTGTGIALCEYCRGPADGCAAGDWKPASFLFGVCKFEGITCVDGGTTPGNTYTLNMRAKDNAGNYGTAAALVRECDTSAPWINTPTTPAPATTTHVPTSFTLSSLATDAAGLGTAASRCEYCKSTDGTCDTEWANATEATTVTATAGKCEKTSIACSNGEALTLKIRATDTFGLTGTSSGISRACDTAAPTTTATGNDGAAYTFGNWTANNVAVTLSCADGGGSGCASTKYCVDTTNSCSPTTAYSAPFNVTCTAGTTCTQYVRYQSTDNVGNVETTGSQTVRIDKQAPATSGSVSVSPISATYMGSNYTVSGTFTESGVGITACDYCAATSSQVATACATGWTAGTVVGTVCSASGLACTGGTTYYFKARASDSLNNGPTEFGQLNYTCDTTGPSWAAITVRDGLGGDRNLQTQSELKANWTGTPTDTGGSGLDIFRVAVGTGQENAGCSAANTETLRAYSAGTLADTATNINTTLSPVNWNFYYVNVKACDKVGNCACLASDGFRKLDPLVDTTASNPSVAIDSTGAIRILYLDYGNSDLRYATNTGASWTLSTVDATAAGVGAVVSMALDSSDNIYVAYKDAAGPIRYASYAAGTWNTSQVVASGVDPALALDSLGKPHIVYELSGNISYLNCTGTVANCQGATPTWAAAATAVDRTNSVNLSTSPALVLDAGDKAHVVFNEGTVSDWFYTNNIAGGAPWTNVTTIQTANAVGNYAVIVRDSTGKFHSIARDETTAVVRYSNSDAWASPADILTPCSNWGTTSDQTMVRTVGDVLYASLNCSGTGKLMKRSGGTWSTISTNWAGQTVRYQSITADANGNPIIAWTDNGTPYKTYVYVGDP